MPRILLPDASAGEAFRVIALSCFDRFHLSAERFARTGEAEALHQVRVALRQLRSAFAVFAPVLADEETANLRAELKRLSSSLNDARDLDVLGARMPRPPAALIRARAQARAEASAALAAPRARRLMRELEDRMSTPPAQVEGDRPADQPAARFAAQALDRLRRKLRRQRRGLRAHDDAALHEVRILTKKLRYATEFFAGLFPSPKAQRRSGRLLQALRTLQDRLGALQDLAVAPVLLERLGVPRGDGPALPARKALLRSADAQYEATRAVKPFWR